jgi:Putative Actinobacterial Holin-X, holin superfamily III
MVDQKTMINGTTMNTSAKSNGLFENLGSFGADLATLAVLQARLAACDLREGINRVRLSLFALAIGALVCASGTIAFILGLSLWLAARLQIESGAAMMLSGAACLIVAGVIVFFCIRALTPIETAFQRSHEELERNLAWIRTTLVQSGR